MPSDGCDQAWHLPPELLCKIFDEYRQEQVLDNSSTCYRNWMTVTHVCCSWRNAAIDCPSLWSYISDNVGPQWMTIHFERVQSFAPLHIRWSRRHDPSLPSPLVEFIPTNLHRIKDLELEEIDLSWPDDPKVRLLSSSYAPVLQSLSLACTGGFVIPEDTLHKGAPRSRNLVLRNCTAPPKCTSLLQGLTHYHQLIDDTNRYYPMFSAGLLEKMPNLVELKIECEAVWRTSTDGGVAILSALRSLTYTGEMRSCEALLNYIAVPRSARVDIDCTQSQPLIPPLPTGIISPHWISPSSLAQSPPSDFAQGGLKSLRFVLDSHQMTVQMWHDLVQLEQGTERPPPNLSFGAPKFKRGGNLSEESRFLAFQPLEDVISMELDWLWRATGIGLSQAVLSRLTELEHLALCSSAGLSVFLHSLKEGGPPSALPNLKTITARGVAFGPDGGCEERFCDSLVDMVSSRSRLGREIEEVKLVKCSSITQEEIERLKEYVTRVFVE
ncbi:hypothetical protein CC1G_09870 [Coprinopsis cinerea okayama7|uniref:Uncharacterized protein n=1 Tax=Coprinopsis cinerea (strain Okayama-7 / 130 / ATCC MYA-4618 / FGSC 9003) TaxID=240176 RepID=A8N8L1_COPC7|nr:hypothetical protein CC1G_09870 [Coprinopsis cinerea okayama7\|eukprot:XP_001831167.2 hypothetical protein CC1G_09870 [Coprinopsis cinerea okayama7\